MSSVFLKEIQKRQKEKERANKVGLKKIRYFSIFKEQIETLEVTLKLFSDKIELNRNKHELLITKKEKELESNSLWGLAGGSVVGGYYQVHGLANRSNFSLFWGERITISRETKNSIIIDMNNFSISKKTIDIINKYKDIKFEYSHSGYRIIISDMIKTIKHGVFSELTMSVVDDFIKYND